MIKPLLHAVDEWVASRDRLNAFDRILAGEELDDILEDIRRKAGALYNAYAEFKEKGGIDSLIGLEFLSSVEAEHLPDGERLTMFCNATNSLTLSPTGEQRMLVTAHGQTVVWDGQGKAKDLMTGKRPPERDK